MNCNLTTDILDFSLDNNERIKLFEEYFKNNSENDSLELLTRIMGMYQFSGINVLENFLFSITAHSFISNVLKLESAKSLLLYSDKEEKIKKNDTEDEIKIKKENNIEISKKNLKRKSLAYESLDLVLYQEIKSNQLSTPCKIDAIFMLMENINYKDSSLLYFKKIINDEKIECAYRYKVILSLELKNIPDYKFYIKNTCTDFIKNEKNETRYRNLAAQNLLQYNQLENENKIFLEEDIKAEIQDIILSFCNDKNLEYNTRADCVDTLLRLGDDKYKSIAKQIIKKLGRIEGGPETIFNNSQNVHQDEIEKSVYEILEFLLTFSTTKTGQTLIDFDFVCRKIKLIIEVPKCEKCFIDKDESNNKFCSNECEKISERNENVNIALDRIYMDRTLYSKFNITLSGVLIKIWSYILEHKYKEELTTRLIQELSDSAGTCSSGYLSRLVNVLSGYDDKFGIRISWEDQIVANFSGRLNSRVRKITEPDSPFYKEKLNDIIEIYLNSEQELKQNIIKNILNSKPVNKFDIESIYSTYQIPIKEIINEYITTNKDEKIKEIVETFAENVLNEITLETHKFSERPNFLLFFRTYMSSIRQELFEEFKEYLDPVEFDLYFRKAISSYEGCEQFI